MGVEIDIKDRELVSSLRQGDAEAFNKLFQKYSNRIYGFSLRYLKSEPDAEELVQNVFIKIWENRKTLKKDASFKSYLFTIAYNDILKFFRSKSYHQAYVREAIAVANIEDNSAERIDYASVLGEVDKLIEQLPERRRIIFIKSRQEGKSSKEIAAELDISPGTVDNNISEALKFLRKNLKSELLALMLFFALYIQ
jgi:RNA polymerase sigma-70 factor (family 1)